MTGSNGYRETNAERPGLLLKPLSQGADDTTDKCRRVSCDV